ncbi:MAG: hypothetical protein ACE5HD_06970 [Acidobacteriota bacterium]
MSRSPAGEHPAARGGSRAQGPPALTVWAVGLLIALAAVGLRGRQDANTVDDAYITFRCARHLAAGAGLVYNRGENVLGTSSPGYALILAGWSRMIGTADFPHLALWLNACVDGGIVLMLFLLVWSLCPGPHRTRALAALLAAGLYAVDARSVDFSTGGMETPLFVGLLVGCALALSLGHTWSGAVLAGGSVAIRPDGILIIGAFFLALMMRRRGLSMGVLLAAATPAVLTGLAITAFYGDPLPASLRAKAGQVYLLHHDQAARVISGHLAGMTAGWLPVARTVPFLPAAARGFLSLFANSILPGTLCFIGFRRGVPGPARSLLVAYAAIFIAAFAVANPLMMGWYLVPLETTYIVFLSLGTARLAAAGARRWGNWPMRGAGGFVAGGLFLVLVFVPQLRRYEWRPGQERPLAAIRSEWNKIREARYLQAGSEVAAFTGGVARVAAPEIGALGYAYPGPILDTVGLVSPEARRYYPLPPEAVAGINAIPPALILDRRPDFVIFLEIFGRRGLLRDPRFRRDYRLWRTYPSRTFGSHGLLVYVRRASVW